MDTAVALVKAYLELCGYFVLAELPVRTPDVDGYRDLTDLDVVAVRFAHGAPALPRRLARPLRCSSARTRPSGAPRTAWMS